MYALINEMNDGILSRHRTLEAVAKANNKLQRQVKKGNGQSSYLPTHAERIVKGERVGLDESELDEYLEAGYHNQ